MLLKGVCVVREPVVFFSLSEQMRLEYLSPMVSEAVKLLDVRAHYDAICNSWLIYHS